MSIGLKKLLTNTLFFGLSSVATKLLNVLLLPFYVRVLSSEEFATYDLTTQAIGLLLPMLSLSIIEAVFRFNMTKSANRDEIFSCGLQTLSAGYALLVLFTPIIVHFLNWQLGGLAILLYITFSLRQYFDFFLRGLGKVHFIAIISLLESVLIAVLSFLFLTTLELGVYGVLLAFIIGHTSAASAYFLIGRLSRFLIKRVDKLIWKQLLIFSIPLIPNRASWWLNSSLDRFILLHYLGASTAGIYGAICRIPSFVNTIHSIFIQAWQLTANEKNESTDAKEVYTNMYHFYHTGILALASALILGAQDITSIILGVEYGTSWHIVPFLTLAVVFGSMIGFLNSILIAHKRTKKIYIPVLVGGAFGAVLNVMFVPDYGLTAAAVTTTLSYFLIWSLRFKEVTSLGFLFLKQTVFYRDYTLICMLAISVVYFPNRILLCALLFCPLFLLSQAKTIRCAFQKVTF